MSGRAGGADSEMGVRAAVGDRDPSAPGDWATDVEDARSIRVGRYARVELRRAPKSSPPSGTEVATSGNGKAELAAASNWPIEAEGAAEGMGERIEGEKRVEMPDMALAAVEVVAVEDRRRLNAGAGTGEAEAPRDERTRSLRASSMRRHSSEQYKPVTTGSASSSSSRISMISSRTKLRLDDFGGGLVERAATFECEPFFRRAAAVGGG